MDRRVSQDICLSPKPATLANLGMESAEAVLLRLDRRQGRMLGSCIR